MHTSIIDLVDGACAADPDGEWLITDDRSWTFSAARTEIALQAAGLTSVGVGRNDRVVVLAENRPEFVFCWLALMQIGAIEVPVNPRSSGAELAGLIGQVRPRLVVAGEDRLAATAEASPETAIIEVADLAAKGENPAATADVSLDDVAVMIPTSGTTGRSKLVMQTHRAYVMAGESFPWWLDLTADDRLMTSLPLFHVNAPAYSVLGSLAARAGLVLLPGFSASGFLDSARRHGATQFNAIGAMLEILMRNPARPDDATTPLRLCYTGPSPTRARHLEMEERFGLRIVCGYALSESPFGLIWPRGTRPFETLGAPRQHPELGEVNQARVRDDEGSEVGVGGVGELELRNPAVMKGYFEMPEETAAVLDGEWLRTGDLVRVDEGGTFTFVSRKKEVIRRRGENLAPSEVEAALEATSDVVEAAVVGVPSELSEEEVKAFVVAAAGRTIDIPSLHGELLDRLARFKVPRYYEVVAELPHTPTGRVAKHQLPKDRTNAEVDMDDRQHGDDSWLRTSLGSTTPDRIMIGDRDLPSELMGHLSLTELAYLMITGTEPSPGQRRVVDAVLVSLADHGHTPSALATRLTYTGAPESPQAAVAAGLAGAGTVFLGPAGDTALFLSAAVTEAGLDEDSTQERYAAVAQEIVAARVAEGARVPGLGHPVHRDGDPRTPRIYEIAEDNDLLGPHLELLRHVAEAAPDVTGRTLPINGAGAGGAALVDAGIPPELVRGVVLIARTAGLVAHLGEEMRSPLGRRLWLEVEERARPAD